MSTRTPCITAPDYGRSLRGLTLNLLVRDIALALPFHRAVLDAEEVYSDEDFAVLRHAQAEWCLHAEHTYERHPLYPRLRTATPRGVGAELRLHGRDPDAAAAVALRLGFTLLAPPADKPHGLREAYILDAEGYLWVPDVPLPA